ncbi:MAG: hypothetical protein O2958_00245 [Gemmatimonadetes bacterium]|nr:hypothetical protein [Gemmatimonadota bacterium]MDA1102770.1 hypothetical protein [Gemmatimonadota bacterium]
MPTHAYAIMKEMEARTSAQEFSFPRPGPWIVAGWWAFDSAVPTSLAIVSESGLSFNDRTMHDLVE